jgi:hypothetical protein
MDDGGMRRDGESGRAWKEPHTGGPGALLTTASPTIIARQSAHRKLHRRDCTANIHVYSTCNPTQFSLHTVIATIGFQQPLTVPGRTWNNVASPLNHPSDIHDQGAILVPSLRIQIQQLVISNVRDRLRGVRLECQSAFIACHSRRPQRHCSLISRSRSLSHLLLHHRSKMPWSLEHIVSTRFTWARNNQKLMYTHTYL